VKFRPALLLPPPDFRLLTILSFSASARGTLRSPALVVSVVPKTVVAALGDNERWECKQNPRAAFNACDIPEEAWEGDGK